MIIYLNAYEVWRNYGGPEEGSWYYDEGSPIASVPFKVPEEIEKKSWKYRSDLVDEDLTQEPEDRMGGEEINREVRNNVLNLIHDENLPELEAERNRLKEVLDPEFKEGNIYSVNGGTEVWILTEDHIGEHWPKNRPRYE